MTPADTPAQTTDGETAAEACTRLYQEHRHRLVAYARALTGDPALAEDLAAESHFRVRRQITAGHRVEPVPARLAATLRELAAEQGHTPSEGPQQGVLLEQLGWVEAPAGAQQVAYTALLATALVRLPSRQLRVLWLSEVEDWPLEAIAQDLGVSRRAAAGLWRRARNGTRHTMLRTLPGVPENPSCAERWERMAALVSGVAGGRRGWIVLRAHPERCPDCRDRRAVLERADARGAALLGAALLQSFGSGTPRWLRSESGAASETTLSLPKVRTHARGGRFAARIPRQLRGRAGAMTAIGSLAVAGGVLGALTLTDAGANPPAQSSVLQHTAASTSARVNATGTPTAAPFLPASGSSLPSAPSTSTSPAGASGAASSPVAVPGLTSGPPATASRSAGPARASGTAGAAGPAATASTAHPVRRSPSATSSTRAPSASTSPTTTRRPVMTAPAASPSTTAPTAKPTGTPPAPAAPTTAAPSGSTQSASSTGSASAPTTTSLPTDSTTASTTGP